MPTEIKRFVCVHGHFYQPPRENPWLEVVEAQDSAAPFHDWNARITHECYAVNGQARLLNEQKKIARIVNNYARMSFNFGPTLLSWLESNAPRVYRSILAADQRGAERFSGHGPAMAQVYNHIIMPLANTRDRITQIEWGIADFRHRFGRMPEGMWLAETAVDNQTLALMADRGIMFVVLAPAQARRVRKLGTKPGAWHNVSADTVDTRVAYRVPLGKGLSIAAFFYDGRGSQAVAFEGLLNSGDKFAARLMSGFVSDDRPQLVNIATDGESYGHHHRHGEMALAYALEKIEREGNARLSVYGEYLEKFPPEFEAEVIENSAWSCFHGVERWRSDCGCSSNRPGWNQQWRTPLRKALDDLRDALPAMLQPAAARLVHDFDAARNAYISVVLDRSPQVVERFLAAHMLHPEDAVQQVETLRLMEIERNAMLMYTSCGWFFDDISGIETVQVLAYAARVLQLCATVFGAQGEALEPPFLATLRHIRSNVMSQGTGEDIYLTQAKARAVRLEQVAAHHAIGSVFPHDGSSALDAYQVEQLERQESDSGRARLFTGQLRVQSRLTRAAMNVDYAVLHFGDQNLSAAVQPASGQSGKFQSFAAAAHKTFLLGDLPEVVRQMDTSLGRSTYSLHSLFTDEQRRILGQLTERATREVETGLRSLYSQHTSMLHFLADAKMMQPPALRALSQFVTGSSLTLALDRPHVSAAEIADLLERSRQSHVVLDEQRLTFSATQRAKRELIAVQLSLQGQAQPASTLREAVRTIAAIRLLPYELNLWQAQNIWYQSRPFSTTLEPAVAKDFSQLGELLDFAVTEMAPPRGAPQTLPSR